MDLPVMKCRACLALAEETEAARQELYALLTRFPAEAFKTGNVKTEDNVRGIMCHVTFAIFSYSCWMRRVLGRLDLAVEKEMKAEFLARVESLTTPAELEEASAWASSHFYGALSETVDSELNMEFKSNWGDTLSIEMMMEHALVHLIRHRRQLQVYLGDREQRPVRP
jgi:uncharacterized damage-inducible protein DinB